MKTLVTGSSGLVGSSLIPFLESKGHKITRLLRSPSLETPQGLVWNMEHPPSNLAPWEGFDAAIHLAGENVSALRWTEAKKKKIHDSRVKATQNLCNVLSQLKSPPKSLLCASAIGFYGNRGDELLDEKSSAGNGFFPEVCQKWEEACDPAVKKGIRVLNLRLGVLLSQKGGALKKMLTPFQLGVGGIVGNGKQWMSWMSLQDVIRGIEFVLTNEKISGPINFVAPHPVTNREWTKTLGQVLHRPTLFPLPEFVTKILFGEMAEWLLLASTKVQPKKLLELGFTFQDPDLEGAFRRILS